MSAAGKLEFCEGPLVTAMRRGHWLLADELNLAPSEILEAFNRCVEMVSTACPYLSDVCAGT